MTDVAPASSTQSLLRLRIQANGSPLAGRVLTIARGDLVAIIGNSGCGKTTLLRSLAATVAQLRDGVSPHASQRWNISEAAVRAGLLPVAITPQEGESILHHLSAEENLRYYQRLVGRRLDPSTPLAGLGLGAKSRTIAGALSGGERRRLSLAIDLAIEPTVLAADEPLTALDSPTADMVFDEVLRPYARDHAVIFSVHSPLDRWLLSCTQVWVMAPDAGGGPGEVVYAGSGLEFVQRARALNGDDGTPAAHLVLSHLETFLDRATEPRSLTTEPSESEPLPRPTRAVSTALLFWHVLRYEFRTQLVPRIKTATYWIAQGSSVGIVFLANFLLAADRLPFSIPLASISVLVTALFVATVMTSRLWVDSEGANIRHQYLRGVPPGVTVLAKILPTLVEVAFLGGLVLLGRWLLSDQGPFHLRATAPASAAASISWPDHYATLVTSAGLPAVVPMILFVGLVGGMQGLCVSLLVALRQQQETRVRRGAPRSNGGNGLVRASSAAVTIVVIQITVSGAFGQVAADRLAQSVEALPGNFTDLIGSLSPLRWGYNWTLVAEYRRARCDWASVRCVEQDDGLKPAYLNNRCLRLTAHKGGQVAAADPTVPGNWYECDAAVSGNYVEARSETLLDLRRRQSLFEAAGLPVPLESMADGYSASRFRAYEKTRRELDAGGEGAACVLQHALMNYENSLSSILVSRAMYRPRWTDTEFCLRRCPTADWQRGGSFAECDSSAGESRLDPPLRFPILQRVLEEAAVLPSVTMAPCSYGASVGESLGTPSARQMVETSAANGQRLTAIVGSQVRDLCSGPAQTSDRVLAWTMFGTAAFWALLDALLLRQWYRGLQRV